MSNQNEGPPLFCFSYDFHRFYSIKEDPNETETHSRFFTIKEELNEAETPSRFPAIKEELMKLKHHLDFPLLIASDHAGFQLKTRLLEDKSFPWQDLGCFHKERTDYPDWADKLCRQMTENINKAKNLKSVSDPLGVLICGTGQGMAMRANRWASLRASLCWNQEVAFLARNHNKANVLCLPARFINKEQALLILKTFLETKFNPEVSYQRRVEKTNQNPNEL